MLAWLIPLIVVLVLAIVGVYLWAARASLVSLGARVDGEWREVTERLTARVDLIPGLVETVGGYAAHERDALEDASAARAETLAADGPASFSAAQTHVDQAVRGVFAIAEGYPQLQAGREFLDLQARLAEAGDEVQAARRRYNGGVREFNRRITAFPNTLFVKRLGFSARDFFEADDAHAVSEPPRIQF